MHVYTQQGVNFKNDWMRKNILQVICTIISPMTENLMEAKLLKPSDSGPCHSVETESFSCLPRGTFGKWVSGYIIFYKKIQGLSTNNISPTCPIILQKKSRRDISYTHQIIFQPQMSITLRLGNPREPITILRI